MRMIMTSVCCICGDKGKVEELIGCVECEADVSFVHRYCKRSEEGETASWTCDDCLERKIMQLKEKSRKSSRVQDRWIKRSNYKAIKLPDKTESKRGGLFSFLSESKWATQPTPNSLKDTVDHLHNLQQMKACFICGSRRNSMDLIDCKQCHSFFVHSQCKLPQENRSPECDWKCENCMDKKSKLFIHQSSPIKKTSRIRGGLVPRKKLSDKPPKLGFKDQIFRKESGVRLSNHGRTANELIKVPPRSIHSTSISHNGIQVEKKLRRELFVDYSDIFDDDEYSAKKATQVFQNAQHRDRHRTVELGTGTSSDKNRDSDDGKASSKIIKAPAENLQSTSFQHDGCAATTATRGLPRVVRDWRQHFRRGNDSLPVKKRGQIQIEQPLKHMDQCIKGARHDVTGIKHDPVEKRLEYGPVEPIKNPVWQGLVRIQLGSFKTDIELCCYPSTKCSSKVAEAVKGLPNMITFDFKSRSDVWPRRFQMSPVNYEAIAVYFLPKNEKDVVAYDETYDRLVKYTFALLYEVPRKKQNLLIFPSSLLPVECQKLRRKYYMWGSLEEKGR